MVQKYPTMSTTQRKQLDDFIKTKKEEQSTTNLVDQGVVNVEDIAKTSPVLAEAILKKNPGATKTKLSAEDQKKKDANTAVENFINNLEKHYQGAGGASFGSGPLARILGFKTNLEGKVGLNDEASTYNDQKSGFAATLKEITGDTGVLTEQDFQRLSKLLPGLGSTPGEAKNKFGDLRSQVAAKFGGQAGDTTIAPKERGTMDVLGDLFLKAGLNIGQDVGTGAAAPGINQQSEQTIQEAQRLADQARNESDPATQKYLFKQSQDMLSGVSQQSQDLSQSFSEDVNKSVTDRSLSGAVEIASIAELPALMKFMKNLPKNISKATPKSTINAGSATRSNAVKAAKETGKVVDGEDMVSGMKEWQAQAIKANPGKEKQINKIVESTVQQYGGKKFAPDEFFKIWNQVDSGFSQAGVTKSSIEASSDRAMRDVIRKSLEKVAPGFEEGTKTLSKGLQRQKFLNKAIYPAAIGTGVSAGVGIPASLLLYKLLGQKQ